MLVYLGGAIDYVSNAERMYWREDASLHLKEYDISTYNPAAAFSYTNVNAEYGVTERLKLINDQAIACSDVVAFLLPKGTNSVGSIAELAMVVQEYPQIPVVVAIPDIDDSSEISAYLIALLGIVDEDKLKEGETRNYLYIGENAIANMQHRIVDLKDSVQKFQSSLIQYDHAGVVEIHDHTEGIPLGELLDSQDTTQLDGADID